MGEIGIIILLARPRCLATQAMNFRGVKRWAGCGVEPSICRHGTHWR